MKLDLDELKRKICFLEARNKDLKYVIDNDGVLDVVFSYGVDSKSMVERLPSLSRDGGEINYDRLYDSGDSSIKLGRCNPESLEEAKKELAENEKKLNALKKNLEEIEMKSKKSIDNNSEMNKLAKQSNSLFQRIRRMFSRKKGLKKNTEVKEQAREEKQGDLSEELVGLVNEDNVDCRQVPEETIR